VRTVAILGVCVGACSFQPRTPDLGAPADANTTDDATDATDAAAADALTACIQPAADWRFDEGTGTTAADSSGHDNTLALMGTATWAAGRAGTTALSLPGNSWAEIPYNATFAATTRISVTAWIHPDVSRTGAIVVKSARLGPFQDWGFYQEFEEAMFICNFPSPDNRGKTTGIALPINDWSHVAFVLDTDTGTTAFYKNGVFHSSHSITTPLLQHDEPITVGTDGGNTANDFLGRIDELQVWPRALTATEVATLHAGDCIR
jgi:hypothetical protein